MNKPVKFSSTETSPPESSMGGLSFSAALDHIKQGARAARVGWSAEGMFVFLVPGSQFAVNRTPLLGIYPADTIIQYHSHIDLRTPSGVIVPWLASQTDILAEDWEILPPTENNSHE